MTLFMYVAQISEREYTNTEYSERHRNDALSLYRDVPPAFATHRTQTILSEKFDKNSTDDYRSTCTEPEIIVVTIIEARSLVITLDASHQYFDFRFFFFLVRERRFSLLDQFKMVI